MKKIILILLLFNLVGCSSLINIGASTHSAIVGMCTIIGVKDGK